MTAAVFFLGLCMVLYPPVSDFVCGSLQARRISSYTQTVEQCSAEEHARMLSEAEQFNEELRAQPFSMELSPEQTERYKSLLDPVGNGVMGYIQIPAIRISLPVYHGIGDSALGAGAGHVPGSSLPVGGSGTHCLIAGHTGLSSSQLFTNLDRLKEGDAFSVTVLERKLYYCVCDVRVVTPEETHSLRPVEGEDLCTLITCTPYGVNSHRLLVTGRRYTPAAGQEAAERCVLNPYRIAAACVSVILIMLFLGILAGREKRTMQDRNN